MPLLFLLSYIPKLFLLYLCSLVTDSTFPTYPLALNYSYTSLGLHSGYKYSVGPGLGSVLLYYTSS